MPETLDLAFERDLEREIPRLRRYAKVLTRDISRADDLVQSCLTRAIAKQHLWERGTDLRAWLFTILHNEHVNEVRKRFREGTSVAVEDMATTLAAKDRADGSMEMRDLERMLKRLPQKQRAVILLVGIEGMRYEQVAEMLDIPVGTVRSRLSRGRETLRKLLTDENVTANAPINGYHPELSGMRELQMLSRKRDWIR